MHNSTDSDNRSLSTWPHVFTSVTCTSQIAANRFSDGFSYCYWINGEVADVEQQELILYLYTGILSKEKPRMRRSTHFPRTLSLGHYLSAIQETCIPRKCLPLLSERMLPTSICVSFSDECVVFPQKMLVCF